MKIHKSFIAGLDHIQRIDRRGVTLGAHCLPVSRNSRKMLVARLAKTPGRD